MKNRISYFLVLLLTLAACEKILPSSIFVRTHRSFLINSRFLTSINKNILTLGADNKVPIGERYLEKLQNDIISKKMIRRD